MNTRTWIFLTIALMIAGMTLGACGILPIPRPGPDISATLSAATELAPKQPAPSQAAPTLAATPLPTSTQPSVATATATKPPAPGSTVAAPAPLPSFTPTPTAVSAKTNTPTPGASVTTAPAAGGTAKPSVVPTMSGVSPDMQAKISSAKILVYDDARGSTVILPRINKALEGLGLTGTNVVNFNDESGNFLKRLEDGSTWDLIILGDEDRNPTRFGIWDTLKKHVDAKTGLIVETWYLNQISDSQITPMMKECGFEIQENWVRDPDAFNPVRFALYPLIKDHPVFTTPNVLGLPLRLNWVWFGDVGDIYRLSKDSKAELLMGLYPIEKNRWGTLVSCYEGRVIFQGFSTHDYQPEITIKMWQNYIVNTLMAHFKAVGK